MPMCEGRVLCLISLFKYRSIIPIGTMAQRLLGVFAFTIGKTPVRFEPHMKSLFICHFLCNFSQNNYKWNQQPTAYICFIFVVIYLFAKKIKNILIVYMTTMHV